MHPSHSISPIAATFVNTSQVATSANVFFPKIVQATNTEEQPSTSQNFYSLAAVSDKIQFNIERGSVDDEFWNNFKRKLEKKEFYELFHDFLLTNWKPNCAYKQLLKTTQENISKTKKAIGEASMKPKDIIIYYDTSVEIFLHINLRLRATNLIFSLADLDNLNSQLNSCSQSVDKIDIVKKQNRKIAQINEQYNLIFAKVYIPYQIYLGATNSQKLTTDIAALKKSINSLRSNVAKYRGKVDEKHFPFINECLFNLKLHQKISKHVGENVLEKPILSVGTASFRKQESVLPFKKRHIQSTAFALPSSPKKRKTQSCTQPNQLLKNESTSTFRTLKTAKASNNDANELKFVSFLNKMMGKDMYIYHEINIHDDKDVIISPDKYYFSLIMLSALKAQILSLEIKISTANLMQAETQTNKTSIRRKLREHLRNFIDNHLIYEKNIAISSDETINQQPADVSADSMKNDYFSNCNSIKNTKILLANTLQKYNEIILNYNEDVRLKYYFEFINSTSAMSKIKKNYALSSAKIEQILQTVLNISPKLNLTKEKLLGLKFQIDRPPVEDSLWQALKNENLSESELKHYYFCFILTNWKSSLNRFYELKQSIKRTKYNNLDLELRVNLIEKHFQEKLRYQAFHLIHHFLLVIDKCQKIKNLPSNTDLEKKRVIENQIDASVMKIRENYQKVSKIHSDYLTARRSPESIDMKKFNREINTCSHYVYSNTKIDTENTKLHILLINQILEKNKLFLFVTLLEQIYSYINNDAAFASISENPLEKQLQFPSIEKQNTQTCTASKLESVSTQASVQPSKTTLATSELRLAEPLLNFAVLNSSEMLHDAINFSLTPAIQNHGQSPKSNLELEQNHQNHGQSLKPNLKLAQNHGPQNHGQSLKSNLELAQDYGQSLKPNTQNHGQSFKSNLELKQIQPVEQQILCTKEVSSAQKIMHPSQQVFPNSPNAFISTDQITKISFPQIAQVIGAKEQPSTSQNLYFLAAVGEQYSEKFQFNIKREAVNDKFWSEFKKELEQTSFNKLFNHFILTSWEPTDAYRHDLKRAHSITESRKEMLSDRDTIVLHYEALMEAFLCANLKLRAMTLIHAIIDLASSCSQLDGHQLDNKVRCINNQYHLAFSRVYLSYQAYLKKSNAERTAADIISLKLQIKSLKSNMSKWQKEISDAQRVERYLLFINHCLANFRLYGQINEASTLRFMPKQVQFLPFNDADELGAAAQLHLTPAFLPNAEILSAQASTILRLESVDTELANAQPLPPFE